MKQIVVMLNLFQHPSRKIPAQTRRDGSRTKFGMTVGSVAR
jgi:hypothetical protein